MRDKGLYFEPRVVVVAEQPIDHVAAIARTRGPDTVTVDKWFLNDRGDAVGDVRRRASAPVGRDFAYELLSVAGRAARIWHKDDVAAVCEYLRIPAIAPFVFPRALRTAV